MSDYSEAVFEQLRDFIKELEFFCECEEKSLQEGIPGPAVWTKVVEVRLETKRRIIEKLKTILER